MSCPSSKIDSNNTGLRFAIEKCLKELPAAASAIAATGTLTFSDVGNDGDTITVNGTVLTLVDAAPGAGEVLIGATAGDTATAVASAINALAPVNAAAVGTVVTVTAATAGVAGNAITLAKVSTDVTLSSATLSGGEDATYDPVWYPTEPNSYGDMGASVTTVARNPINPSRQRQKGVVTDLEAQASYTMDLTGNNHLMMWQGFMFAHAREKPTTAPLNSVSIPVTSVTTGDGYVMDDSFASQVAVGDLVFAEGFSIPANNGLKLVSAVAAGKVTFAGAANEASPPVTASVTVVGFQAGSGDLALVVSGGEVRLTSVTLNLTTLGLLAGEWIYVGGDASNTAFGLRGFARVDAITANYLILGKTSWTAVSDSGAGKTVRLFLGTVIRNEEDPDDIIRSTFQFERTLGEDTDGVMSQYVIGSVANELTLNIPQAEKITAEMGFVACDAVVRTGAEGLKAGTRPTLEQSDAFNTSSDVRRIAFSLHGENTPLFVYATDLTITVKNNASGAKAVGVLGNFDINIGVFDVGGSVTAYFQDVRAVNAVRENSDVTMDLILVKNNMGLVWDIPLMALGNGMIAVEQDAAITVPLDTMAAQSSFGHTLLYVNFPYLPNAA